VKILLNMLQTLMTKELNASPFKNLVIVNSLINDV